jgi:hypothetical protein
MKYPKIEQFSNEETKARFEAALRGARVAGAKPHSEMKISKSKPKRKKKKDESGR